MFVNERQTAILRLLEKNKKASVQELSDCFHLSGVTIRKDLDCLEREGLVTRTFGGVLFKEPLKSVSSCSIPPETLTDYGRKQAIGALAAQLVEDEDFIFLGPGYTCLEVAKNLKTKNRLAITTMNVSAAIELANTPEFNILLAPGNFTKRNGTYYVTGSVLMDYFSNAYFDKLFLTIDGISLERGFSVLDDITARIFTNLISRTSKVIVCAATSKFEKSAMAQLGPITLADTLVTDGPIPKEYEALFQKASVQVIHP